MNTASNSRPLAECTVISCIASCPACAWLSPASSEACDRKADSGDITARQRRVGVEDFHAVLVDDGRARLASDGGPMQRRRGAAEAFLGTNWVAALTSCSRFSMRSAPSFSFW